MPPRVWRRLEPDLPKLLRCVSKFSCPAYNFRKLEALQAGRADVYTLAHEVVLSCQRCCQAVRKS
eukprot:501150-Pyramimonas_sp.AAC.1